MPALKLAPLRPHGSEAVLYIPIHKRRLRHVPPEATNKIGTAMPSGLLCCGQICSHGQRQFLQPRHVHINLHNAGLRSADNNSNADHKVSSPDIHKAVVTETFLHRYARATSLYRFNLAHVPFVHPPVDGCTT